MYKEFTPLLHHATHNVRAVLWGWICDALINKLMLQNSDLPDFITFLSDFCHGIICYSTGLIVGYIFPIYPYYALHMCGDGERNIIVFFKIPY